MSIEKCKAALRAAVAAINPTRNSRNGFVCVQDERSGRRVTLEEMGEGTRYFDIIEDGLPVPAGEGIRTCRWEQRLLIRVRYDNTLDADVLLSQIGEDVVSIGRAIRKPSNWDQANSGLRSLLHNEDADPESLGEDEERPDAFIVPIPITITYKDC